MLHYNHYYINNCHHCSLVVGFLFLFKSGIKYNDLSKNFREIKNLSSKELGDKIGGKVKK